MTFILIVGLFVLLPGEILAEIFNLAWPISMNLSLSKTEKMQTFFKVNLTWCSHFI